MLLFRLEDRLIDTDVMIISQPTHKGHQRTLTGRVMAYQRIGHDNRTSVNKRVAWNAMLPL